MRALLILLLLSACAAEPDALCRLEKLGDLPVQTLYNVPVVTVEINGKPASLVLDTGSDATVLTRTAARRLGISDSGTTRSLGGAGGPATLGNATITSLVVGGTRFANVKTLLGDAPAPPIDGVLGIDVLVDFEVELDLPHHRVGLYRARRCAAARPDWAGPITLLPVRPRAGSGHLFVSLEVDGQPLRGMLDSGASRTTLSLQSAEDTGLGHRALNRLPRTRGQAINPAGVAVQQATFKTLRIGTDTLDRPQMTIIDLPAFAGDLLVGEDYLGTRRVWFSFLLGRVWVAP